MRFLLIILSLILIFVQYNPYANHLLHSSNTDLTSQLPHLHSNTTQSLLEQPPPLTATLHDYKYNLLQAPYFQNLSLDQIMYIWIELLHTYTSTTLKIMNPTLSLFDLTTLLTKTQNNTDIITKNDLITNILSPLFPHIALEHMLELTQDETLSHDFKLKGNNIENDLFQIKHLSDELHDDADEYDGEVYISRKTDDSFINPSRKSLTSWFKSLFSSKTSTPESESTIKDQIDQDDQNDNKELPKPIESTIQQQQQPPLQQQQSIQTMRGNNMTMTTPPNIYINNTTPTKPTSIPLPQTPVVQNQTNLFKNAHQTILAQENRQFIKDNEQQNENDRLNSPHNRNNKNINNINHINPTINRNVFSHPKSFTNQDIYAIMNYSSHFMPMKTFDNMNTTYSQEELLFALNNTSTNSTTSTSTNSTSTTSTTHGANMIPPITTTKNQTDIDNDSRQELINIIMEFSTSIFVYNGVEIDDIINEEKDNTNDDTINDHTSRNKKNKRSKHQQSTSKYTIHTHGANILLLNDFQDDINSNDNNNHHSIRQPGENFQRMETNAFSTIANGKLLAAELTLQDSINEQNKEENNNHHPNIYINNDDNALTSVQQPLTLIQSIPLPTDQSQSAQRQRIIITTLQSLSIRELNDLCSNILFYRFYHITNTFMHKISQFDPIFHPLHFTQHETILLQHFNPRYNVTTTTTTSTSTTTNVHDIIPKVEEDMFAYHYYQHISTFHATTFINDTTTPDLQLNSQNQTTSSPQSPQSSTSSTTSKTPSTIQSPLTPDLNLIPKRFLTVFPIYLRLISSPLFPYSQQVNRLVSILNTLEHQLHIYEYVIPTTPIQQQPQQSSKKRNDDKIKINDDTNQLENANPPQRILDDNFHIRQKLSALTMISRQLVLVIDIIDQLDRIDLIAVYQQLLRDYELDDKVNEYFILLAEQLELNEQQHQITTNTTIKASVVPDISLNKDDVKRFKQENKDDLKLNNSSNTNAINNINPHDESIHLGPALFIVFFIPIVGIILVWNQYLEPRVYNIYGLLFTLQNRRFPNEEELNIIMTTANPLPGPIDESTALLNKLKRQDSRFLDMFDPNDEVAILPTPINQYVPLETHLLDDNDCNGNKNNTNKQLYGTFNHNTNNNLSHDQRSTGSNHSNSRHNIHGNNNNTSTGALLMLQEKVTLTIPPPQTTTREYGVDGRLITNNNHRNIIIKEDGNNKYKQQPHPVHSQFEKLKKSLHSSTPTPTDEKMFHLSRMMSMPASQFSHSLTSSSLTKSTSSPNTTPTTPSQPILQLLPKTTSLPTESTTNTILTPSTTNIDTDSSTPQTPLYSSFQSNKPSPLQHTSSLDIQPTQLISMVEHNINNDSNNSSPNAFIPEQLHFSTLEQHPSKDSSTPSHPSPLQPSQLHQQTSQQHSQHPKRLQESKQQQLQAHNNNYNMIINKNSNPGNNSPQQQRRQRSSSILGLNSSPYQPPRSGLDLNQAPLALNNSNHSSNSNYVTPQSASSSIFATNNSNTTTTTSNNNTTIPTTNIPTNNTKSPSKTLQSIQHNQQQQHITTQVANAIPNLIDATPYERYELDNPNAMYQSYYNGDVNKSPSLSSTTLTTKPKLSTQSSVGLNRTSSTTDQIESVEL